MRLQPQTEHPHGLIDVDFDELFMKNRLVMFAFHAYWRRAHSDWRVWIIVILMLATMPVYLMTGDLRWRLHAQPQPVVLIAGLKAVCMFGSYRRGKRALLRKTLNQKLSRCDGENTP